MSHRTVRQHLKFEDLSSGKMLKVAVLVSDEVEALP